jgi:hypothetical protein
VEAARLAALSELDRLIGLGLHEQGRVEELYDRTSATVRGYIEHLDPAWGPDFTVTELMERLGERADRTAATGLLGEMLAAEVVKFGRRRPGAEEAVEHWRALRAGVQAGESRADDRSAAPGGGARSGSAEPEGGASNGSAESGSGA